MTISVEIFNSAFKLSGNYVSFFSYTHSETRSYSLDELVAISFQNMMQMYKATGIVMVPDRYIPRFMMVTKCYRALRLVYHLSDGRLDVQYICISPEVFTSALYDHDFTEYESPHIGSVAHKADTTDFSGGMDSDFSREALHDMLWQILSHEVDDADSNEPEINKSGV